LNIEEKEILDQTIDVYTLVS